jgi:hypothetical protein
MRRLRGFNPPGTPKSKGKGIDSHVTYAINTLHELIDSFVLCVAVVGQVDVVLESLQGKTHIVDAILASVGNSITSQLHEGTVVRINVKICPGTANGFVRHGSKSLSEIHTSTGAKVGECQKCE